MLQVWCQLQTKVARFTVARLMKALGYTDVLRSKKDELSVSQKETTLNDRMNCQFIAE